MLLEFVAAFALRMLTKMAYVISMNLVVQTLPTLTSIPTQLLMMVHASSAAASLNMHVTTILKLNIKYLEHVTSLLAWDVLTQKLATTILQHQLMTALAITRTKIIIVTDCVLTILTLMAFVTKMRSKDVQIYLIPDTILMLLMMMDLA